MSTTPATVTPTRHKSGALKWVLRRVRQLVATVAGVVLITFGMVHFLPGDPAIAILGMQVTPENLKALRAQLHLDRPITVQLLDYLGELVRGDLGESIIQSGRSVTALVFPALGITMWVIASSIVLGVLLAVPIGLLAGWSRKRGVDVSVRMGAVLLLATPPFVAGLILLLVVALWLGAAPTGGWAGNFLGDWAYLWLPVLALTAHLLPTLVIVVRQSVREIAHASFVEAAISRGISNERVIVNHVMRNSCLPLITVVGMNLGGLIGGAVVIETVFTLPGLGSLLVSSVMVRDYPVVQGAVLVVGCVTILGNFAADVLYRAVDPRTRGAEE